MKILDIISYLQDEMPDHMEPEMLAAFVMTIVTGYLGDPKTAIQFLRHIVESAEKNMDTIMDNFPDVADEP